MKRFITLCITAMIYAVFASAGTQATEPAPQKSDAATTVAPREYSCTVTVYAKGSRSNWLYEGATVTGLASGGMTKDVKTDSKGRATLVWSSGSELKAIYVKGTRFGETSTKFEGPFEDGGSYTFYIDA